MSPAKSSQKRQLPLDTEINNNKKRRKFYIPTELLHNIYLEELTRTHEKVITDRTVAYDTNQKKSTQNNTNRTMSDEKTKNFYQSSQQAQQQQISKPDKSSLQDNQKTPGKSTETNGHIQRTYSENSLPNANQALIDLIKLRSKLNKNAHGSPRSKESHDGKSTENNSIGQGTSHQVVTINASSNPQNTTNANANVKHLSSITSQPCALDKKSQSKKQPPTYEQTLSQHPHKNNVTNTGTAEAKFLHPMAHLMMQNNSTAEYSSSIANLKSHYEKLHGVKQPPAYGQILPHKSSKNNVPITGTADNIPLDPNASFSHNDEYIPLPVQNINNQLLQNQNPKKNQIRPPVYGQSLRKHTHTNKSTAGITDMRLLDQNRHFDSAMQSIATSEHLREANQYIQIQQKHGMKLPEINEHSLTNYSHGIERAIERPGINSLDQNGYFSRVIHSISTAGHLPSEANPSIQFKPNYGNIQTPACGPPIHQELQRNSVVITGTAETVRFYNNSTHNCMVANSSSTVQRRPNVGHSVIADNIDQRAHLQGVRHNGPYHTQYSSNLAKPFRNHSYVKPCLPVFKGYLVEDPYTGAHFISNSIEANPHAYYQRVFLEDTRNNTIATPGANPSNLFSERLQQHARVYENAQIQHPHIPRGVYEIPREMQEITQRPFLQPVPKNTLLAAQNKVAQQNFSVPKSYSYRDPRMRKKIEENANAVKCTRSNVYLQSVSETFVNTSLQQSCAQEKSSSKYIDSYINGPYMCLEKDEEDTPAADQNPLNIKGESQMAEPHSSVHKTPKIKNTTSLERNTTAELIKKGVQKIPNNDDNRNQTKIRDDNDLNGNYNDGTLSISKGLTNTKGKENTISENNAYNDKNEDDNCKIDYEVTVSTPKGIIITKCKSKRRNKKSQVHVENNDKADSNTTASISKDIIKTKDKSTSTRNKDQICDNNNNDDGKKDDIINASTSKDITTTNKTKTRSNNKHVYDKAKHETDYKTTASTSKGVTITKNKSSTSNENICDKDNDYYDDNYDNFDDDYWEAIYKATEHKSNTKKGIKLNKYAKKINLPPEYDPSDTKWTLKFETSGPGIVEVSPDPGTYVEDKSFKLCTQMASDCDALARILLIEIFTPNALNVCGVIRSKERPRLDDGAIMTIILFILKYAEDHGITSNTNSVIQSLRNEIEKLRQN